MVKSSPVFVGQSGETSMYSNVMRASLFSSVGQKKGLAGNKETEALGDPAVMEEGREECGGEVAPDDPRRPPTSFRPPKIGELWPELPVEPVMEEVR